MFLRKIVAFIRKDFLLQASYRLNFILIWLAIPVQVATFYFIAKLFGNSNSPYLKECGGDYFPFVLIGIAFSNYLSTALRSLATKIREEQMMGTLEAIVLTPTKILTLAVSLPCWDFIFALINISIYLFTGICLLGVKLPSVDIFAVGIILFLIVVSSSSIGMLSAAFIVVFKKGDPIVWAVSSFTIFFGGAFFPVELLPKSLQYISNILPVTYSIRALRRSVLQGYSFKMLAHDIGMLTVLCVLLFLFSLWLFNCAIKKAKKDGSLAHY
jgi:ABC-2 type transport system permease protein